MKAGKDTNNVSARASRTSDEWSRDFRDTRVVILGGGKGLSTVVGGDSMSAAWGEHPFVGLKEEYPNLDVVVVTTDDGGSTGRLLKELPMIGIGDLRKSCLSLIRRRNLQRIYRISDDQVLPLAKLLQRIFNYRFPEGIKDFSIMNNPLLVAPAGLRECCPHPLVEALSALGSYLSPGGPGPDINPSGHCLGNLLLTAAIFRAAGGRLDRPPGLGPLQAGVDEVARLIGSTPRRLHAATSTPGQLKFRYLSGVEVYGQMKSAHARRGFPVERIISEFIRPPRVSASVIRAISRADVIIYAPGSLYTSLMPLLQIEPITNAIRANHRALKILAANFWIQRGETDLSPEAGGVGFLVSDLIEAYNRNVPGGARGLFKVILSANLEAMPGNILRNYALEGKKPIFLDRERVKSMGFETVEAVLFSIRNMKSSSMLHHDPRNFARALREILIARNFPGKKPPRPRGERKQGPPPARKVAPHCPGFLRYQPGFLLCDYLAVINRQLSRKRFQPPNLRSVMTDLAWENRDILPSHLGYFRGVRVIEEKAWTRSTKWDNVLGYYDPDDGFLKLHQRLLSTPKRMREDLLIALGESLLGNYVENQSFRAVSSPEVDGAFCYQIRLRSPARRRTFLSDRQLQSYLRMSRMVGDKYDPLIWRITINDGEGFLPPGLLFGLMYAWYLNDWYGGLLNYEMSLLQCPPETLIPHQAKEYARRQALVTFFRREIFRHREE